MALRQQLPEKIATEFALSRVCFTVIQLAADEALELDELAGEAARAA